MLDSPASDTGARRPAPKDLDNLTTYLFALPE
jgi:hypothetical protein